MSQRPAAVVVLAAGEGTRMRSALPKVLHPVLGRTMLGHVLAAASELNPVQVVVVVGHGRAAVTEYLAEHHPDVRSVVQEQQLGTGHAVRVALDAVPVTDPADAVVVLAGDAPLLAGGTLRALLDEHTAGAAAATVLSAHVEDPTGYGRVVRATDGSVVGIVEEKDADPVQRAITEINSGGYVFAAGPLRAALGGLGTANAAGEQYLTDVLAALRADGLPVGAVVAASAVEVLGVNDRAQLATAQALLRDRVVDRWMRTGVTVVDPRTTWIGVDVTLEPDAVLLPGTELAGSTHVAAFARVGPDCTLIDTWVGPGARVRRTEATGARIGADADVGPFSYLRPGTVLAEHAKVGAYVEVKNSVVGEGSKVPHLSYVGDARIGAHTNIGAATVFVNYDGTAKHATVVGDHVRVGSDSMLVAPVSVGDGAYTAAGSVITEDVPPGAMGIARSRQTNIEGWVERRRPGTPAAEAARVSRAAPAPAPADPGPENGSGPDSPGA